MIFWRKDKEKTESPAKAEEVLPPAPVAVPEPVVTAAESEPGQQGDRPGETWVSRLGMGLAKSSAKLGQDLTDLVTKKKLDQETLDQLEEILITADLGPKTAARIVTDFAEGRFGKDIDQAEVKEALSGVIAKILTPVAKPLVITKPDNGPFVILVCGVNGAGKTTTIGKLAHRWVKQDGHSVMIAAADTFRAAAVQQLKVWSDRAGATFMSKDEGADAAAVAYEAYAKAVQDNADILIIDTAGRLQNKSNLMAELEKIIRVLKKHDESIPHATLLVLDATTGQNAYSQVEIFTEVTKVSGLIVTKLDGSAKGGVVVGLADRFGLPIHAVGVGEGINDLQAFDAQEFAKSLTGLV